MTMEEIQSGPVEHLYIIENWISSAVMLKGDGIMETLTNNG